MKKTLLSLAALFTAFCASAETVTDVDQHYTDMTEFPFFVMDFKPEVANGNLVVTNPEAIDNYKVQYFVCYDFDVNPKENYEYTVTAKIKSNVAGNITVVLGNWGATVDTPMAVTGDNEWHEVSAKLSGITKDKSFVIFQSGQMVGTYEIEYVKVTHDAEPVVLPTTGNIIKSYYTGNGATLGGWGEGATFENVDEDGKPCLKFNNPTSTDDWKVQMAIDTELTFGETYYLGFDVKGTPFTGITVGIQNSEKYSSKGNMTKFNVTEDWKHVIIYGTPVEGDDKTYPANRIVFNLGKYAGTMYMTNVTLYTVSSSGIAENIIDATARWTVYNLQGICVLDTDDKSMLSTLRPGLYIVNGKKTAIMN